jgi:hypothetical protein
MAGVGLMILNSRQKLSLQITVYKNLKGPYFEIRSTDLLSFKSCSPIGSNQIILIRRGLRYPRLPLLSRRSAHPVQLK